MNTLEPEYSRNSAFEKLDLSSRPLPGREYDRCTFVNCDFSNADLSGVLFLDCTFTACNLSLANLSGTSFRDVSFSGCKMIGLQFGNCNPFSVLFTFLDCVLDHSSFYRLKIKKTHFAGCRMKEADFSETDLTSAIFEQCDLSGSTFDHTNLEYADLRSATGFSIDPDDNRVRKARFTIPTVVGLLDKYDLDIEF